MSLPKHHLELLSPARDVEIAREAILHGADAIYIGGPSFGARHNACNEVSDIARLVEFARRYHARVFTTLNTIFHDDELEQVRTLIHQLYDAGVDALIVQDMGVMELDIPPIELHASTQTDIRTLERAKFLDQAGFSQLVLARELTVEQIRSAYQPMLLASRRLLGDDGQLVSPREISERTGIDLDFLQRLQRASGLPRAEDPDAPSQMRIDGDALGYAQRFRELGFDEDQVVLVVQVLTEGLARAAEVMRYAALAAVSAFCRCSSICSRKPWASFSISLTFCASACRRRATSSSRPSRWRWCSITVLSRPSRRCSRA